MFVCFFLNQMYKHIICIKLYWTRIESFQHLSEVFPPRCIKSWFGLLADLFNKWNENDEIFSWCAGLPEKQTPRLEQRLYCLSCRWARNHIYRALTIFTSARCGPGRCVNKDHPHNSQGFVVVAGSLTHVFLCVCSWFTPAVWIMEVRSDF